MSNQLPVNSVIDDTTPANAPPGFHLLAKPSHLVAVPGNAPLHPVGTVLRQGMESERDRVGEKKKPITTYGEK